MTKLIIYSVEGYKIYDKDISEIRIYIKGPGLYSEDIEEVTIDYYAKIVEVNTKDNKIIVPLNSIIAIKYKEVKEGEEKNMEAGK